MPVDAAIFEPVLSGSAAIEIAIATLPLTPGYRAYLTAFDLMSSKVQSFLPEVKEKETIKVKAGEYETYKVELFSLEEMK